MNFNFSKSERNHIVQSTISQLETIYNNPRKELAVSGDFKAEKVSSEASNFSFDQTNNAEEVMQHIIEGIKNTAFR